MTRPDDSTITTAQAALIRKHAKRALQDAGALGRFPTPVADIMNRAEVVVAAENALDESFLLRLRRQTSHGLRRALSKVFGVLDAVARIVYIDRTLHIAKQTFLKLHETAHAVLPWQRDLYSVVEDCAKTLDPDISEQFEREANVFATEVLYQLDTFIDEARDHAFGILVPVRLSKKYGGSIYSGIRQYVSKHHRACCVLVINPPKLTNGSGFIATLRRVGVSSEFQRLFGELSWPEKFTPEDEIGAMIPVGGRRMSCPRERTLVDRNGERHACVAEAFTQSHQIFVLIHAVATLKRSVVAVR